MSSRAQPRRDEGPRLPEIPVSDDWFKGILKVSRYRLRIRGYHLGNDGARQVSRWAYYMEGTIGKRVFIGRKPEESLKFLSYFRRQCDDAGISEAVALHLLPHFLGERAFNNFNTYLGDGASGFQSWKEAVVVQ